MLTSVTSMLRLGDNNNEERRTSPVTLPRHTASECDRRSLPFPAGGVQGNGSYSVAVAHPARTGRGPAPRGRGLGGRAEADDGAAVQRQRHERPVGAQVSHRGLGRQQWLGTLRRLCLSCGR